MLYNSDMQNVAYGLHAALYLCNMAGDLISETENIKIRNLTSNYFIHNIIKYYSEICCIIDNTSFL